MTNTAGRSSWRQSAIGFVAMLCGACQVQSAASDADRVVVGSDAAVFDATTSVDGDVGQSDAAVGDIEVGPNAEDWNSAFGVFAPFTGEFAGFELAGDMSHQEYLDWAGDEMQALGAKWTRSNMQLMWALIEPVIGAGYQWDNLMQTDATFGAAANAGVHYLGVFHEAGVVGRTGAPARDPYENLQAYKQFVTAVVERYDGDGVDDAPNGAVIKHWQVGNESPSFNGDVDTYVTWFSDVARTIRQADAEAKVFLIASVDANQMDSLHEQAFAQLAVAGVAVDGVDLHHWGNADNVEMRAVPQYQALFAQLGLGDVEIGSYEHGTYVGQVVSYTDNCDLSCADGKVCVMAGPDHPLCVVRCVDDSRCPDMRPACNVDSGICGEAPQSEADQARSLVKRYVVNLDAGVRRIMWNNLASWNCFAGGCGGIFDRIGLVSGGFLEFETEADWGHRRAAWYAYRLLAEKTDVMYAERLGRLDVDDDTVYVSQYRSRHSGRLGYVVWGQGSGQVSLTVDSSTAVVTSFLTDTDAQPVRHENLSAQSGFVHIAYDTDPVWVETTR